MNYFVFDINDSVKERKINNNDIRKNIDILIDKFTLMPINRYFTLENQENHKLSQIKKSVAKKDNFHSEITELANDLLEAESVTDKNGKRRNKNIKSGILIIRIDSKDIIVMKLEEINTINRVDFSINKNIGGEKDYYKIAIIPLEEEKDIKIIDSNEFTSKFWTNKFLKLIPVRDSQKNTEEILNIIDEDKLFNDDIFDNEELKQKVIHDYLKNRNSFDIHELILYINDYLEDDLSYEEIINQENLSDIDTTFVIYPPAIDAFFKRSIRLNEYVSINIKDIYEAKEAGAIEYDSNTGGIIILPSNDIDILNKIPSLREENEEGG